MPTPSDPEIVRAQASLRRTHLSVLALLAACGVSIVLGGGDAEPPPPDAATLVALGLAFSIITARRLATSPRVGPRARVWLHLASFVIALSLGGLGILIAWSLDSVESGVLLPVGAFILCLRAPPPLVDPPRALPPHSLAGHTR